MRLQIKLKFLVWTMFVPLLTLLRKPGTYLFKYFPVYVKPPKSTKLALNGGATSEIKVQH